jgi:hypothetical protein
LIPIFVALSFSTYSFADEHRNYNIAAYCEKVSDVEKALALLGRKDEYVAYVFSPDNSCVDYQIAHMLGVIPVGHIEIIDQDPVEVNRGNMDSQGTLYRVVSFKYEGQLIYTWQPLKGKMI